MPEFFLDGMETPEFRALDSFTQGYIQAAFFSSGAADGTTRKTWNPETDASLPGDVGFEDLAPSALEEMIRDCTAFQEAHKADIETWEPYRANGDAYEQAGLDFWYTRNGHGVGFWESGRGWSGEAQDRLDAAARAAGQCDLYLGDDGKVYT